MVFEYSKLWKFFDEKKMYKEDLRIDTRMSFATIDKLGKNEIVTMDVLVRICGNLKCDIEDIFNYKIES